ncbi:MAG TPA: hypothetical protein VGQ99_05785 [Tepidisphaeraceae bacterium]|jgi:hypothetical protein|nr:hypothetical protein [Tepidisphaeraceae bacterium]
MRVPLLFFLLLLATPLLGADTTRRYVPEYDPSIRSDTIRAATSNAVRNLYDEVARQPLTPQLSIRSYLKTMKLEDDFLKTLQSAEQVGDPRWVNHTCQVQLEIPAARVSYALRQFADANPKKSPITGLEIDRASRNWPQSVFGATGSAAGSGSDVRPRIGSKWAAVRADARQRALDDASADAARRVMDSVKDIPLGNKKTVADAFADPQIAARIRNWLTSRPMTRVDFQDNLDVEVALAADPRDFFDLFRETLQNQNNLPPTNPDDWREIEKDFLVKTAPAVGHAKVPDTKVTPAANLVRVPPKAPAWIDKSITVIGVSPSVGGKLKTARAAERDAQAKLIERIESLELDTSLTLGQAARQDPRIAAAISRTIERINPHKIQYNPDGSVAVHCQADLRDLWDELRH